MNDLSKLDHEVISLKSSILVALADAAADERYLTIQDLLDFFNDHRDTDELVSLSAMTAAVNELIVQDRIRVKLLQPEVGCAVRVCLEGVL